MASLLGHCHGEKTKSEAQHFVKSDEQWRACSVIAMARKSKITSNTCEEIIAPKAQATWDCAIISQRILVSKFKIAHYALTPREGHRKQAELVSVQNISKQDLEHFVCFTTEKNKNIGHLYPKVLMFNGKNADVLHREFRCFLA